ncbi:hypothetical protein D3C81_1325860 [compost metagenome]
MAKSVSVWAKASTGYIGKVVRGIAPMPTMPAYSIVAPGMPPPATPLPMKMIGGLAGSISACDTPSEAVAVFSSYAHWFCAGVGSGRVGCAIVPVSVTPARVG